MRYFLPIIILCLLCFTACNSKQKQADEKPVLTVTIEPLRFFTQAIAGDKYKVVSMVPAGSNPETYDPTPQQFIFGIRLAMRGLSPEIYAGLYANWIQYILLTIRRD